MEAYHEVWLASHPERSREWLIDRLRDGFHIHHVDGDHSNDNPANLVLIDGVDHLRLHGVSVQAGIDAWREKSRQRQDNDEQAGKLYRMKAEMRRPWVAVAQAFYGDEKPSDRSWHDIAQPLSNKARKYAIAYELPWPPSE